MKNVITFLLIGFSLVLLSTSISFSQESREIQKTVDLNSDGRVFIDTYKGSITIKTWDKQQVMIHAKIEADGWGRHEEEKVRDTEIRIHSSPDRLDIKTDYNEIEHHGFSFFNLFGENSGNMPFVHYDITMPATAHLKIKDYKSDTKIADLSSSLKMETYKGTVVIEEQNGAVEFETYKGEAKIEFTKFSGDSRFETYKGRIELLIPKGAGFKLDADIGRRADFNCDFDISVNRKSRGDSYFRASVNGGGPLLRINSEKGDIRIRQR